MQLGAAAPAAVALPGQPGLEASGAEPGGFLRAGEARQERLGDGGVEPGEEPDRAREDERQVGLELLHEPDPGAHEVLARSHARTERHRGRGVGHERAQAVAVGAQDVGEDVGIGAVVLVAGAAVAAAQGLDAATGDDDDPQARAQEGIDERAVGALDGDPAHAAGPQSGDEVPQTGVRVLDLVALEHRAGSVDDADRVTPGRPVDAGERGGGSRMHPCLRAGRSSLGAPFVTGRVRRSLTDSALGWRAALSRLGTSLAAGPRGTIAGRRSGERHGR